MTDAPQVAVSLPAVVGAILLAKRREQDLSQLAMAEAVGINVSTLSRVENGDSAMTLEQLVSAAAVLGVQPSSILVEAEAKLEELAKRGFATGADRAGLLAIAGSGAVIPLAGSALVGVLGPIATLPIIGSAVAARYILGKVKRVTKSEK